MPAKLHLLTELSKKYKKMKKLLFIIIVLVATAGCDNNDMDIKTLNGVWVETVHKTDTLIFDNQLSFLILNRGTEMRNGYVLPKYNSGPYMFETEKDSISLHWAASSSLSSYKYYFKPDFKKKEIRIGNFFDENINAGVILTFKKVQ